MKDRSPGAVIFLAVMLLALGFVAGFGYQSQQHAIQNSENPNSTNPSPPKPPQVRNLRVSPDGRLAAFTVLYQNSQQAGRFIFDLHTNQYNESETPRGWQDSIAQWNRQGDAILFQREKIPRTTDDATPGLHSETIKRQTDKFTRSEAQPLFQGEEPAGEKTYTGFWAPDGKLVVKTRRESKALFAEENGSAKLIDRSPGTYYQNRAIQENGKTAFYLVRDISVAEKTVGVFRAQNGHTRQLGAALSDVIWAYLADDARHLLVCRYAPGSSDWQWTLYKVSPTGLAQIKQAIVPQDVIAVYWSPDYHQVLGAAGKSLWVVSIPDLKVRKLGKNDDWSADDAAWIDKEQSVLVASQGYLWKVNTQTGERHELWKFPGKYWTQ